MKLTKKLLSIYKIHNGHGLCSWVDGKAFISYCAAEPRACRSAKWAVYGIGFKTNPKSHWSDCGNMVFIGKMRSPALDEAKAWASKQFGIKEWERDPFGNWQDKVIMDNVRAHLHQE